jgi:hypothetical protein
LRNTFLTSRTGLKATSTVPLDEEDAGTAVAIESETPETIFISRGGLRYFVVGDASAGDVANLAKLFKTE